MDCLKNIFKNSKTLQGPFNMRDVGDISDSIGYYNSILEDNNLSKISKEDESKIIDEALKISDEVKPIIYIDEFYYEP